MLAETKTAPKVKPMPDADFVVTQGAFQEVGQQLLSRKKVEQFIAAHVGSGAQEVIARASELFLLNSLFDNYLQNSFPRTPAKSRVKPQNHLTACQQTTCTWHVHPVPFRIIKVRERKKPSIVALRALPFKSIVYEEPSIE
jgi:hypothetical protein